MRALPAILVGALLAGCSYNDAMDKNASWFDTGGGELAEGTLRLDVLPPTSAGDGTLLPQSTIVAPGAYEGLDVELIPTRTISGTLTAEVARGWSFGPPTSTEPLVATLRALPGNGRLSGSAVSAEDGTFTLAYPAYKPERFSIAIVPQDASMAPLRVVAAPTADTTGWDQSIEAGIPVYGRVTGLVFGVEQGIEGVQMRISRVAGDDVLTSGTFTTDATGWYVARVDEIGEYTLEVVGGPTTEPGRVAPAVSLPVLVESEDGVELAIGLGAVEGATADGAVVDPGGEQVAEPRVRFTSTALDGGVGSLVVENVGTPQGDFISRELLPGTYDIEIMPPAQAEPTLSPLRVGGRRIDADTSLGPFRLEAATRLGGTVLDVEGTPAGQALVVATEVGFAGNVYHTYTDGDGRFDLAVPNVPLVLTLTPASTADGAVRYVSVDAPSTDLLLELEVGVLVEGVLSYDDLPVAYGSVQVYDAGSGLLLGQAISDSQGAFSLRVSLPEGEDVTDTGGGDTGDTGGDTSAKDTSGEDTSGGDTSGGDTSGGDTSGGDTSGGDTASDSGR